MDKNALRTRLKTQRAAASKSWRASASERIADQLAADPRFTGSPSIGLYAPIASEVDTTPIERRAADLGLPVAYPRVEGNTLVFQYAKRSELQRVPPWQIEEPSGDSPRAAFLGLVVVPGLAFGRLGERLGYGKGFYDRYIRACRNRGLNTRFVGLGFALQLAEGVPMDEHDERVDGLVTEDGLHWFP